MPLLGVGAIEARLWERLWERAGAGAVVLDSLEREEAVGAISEAGSRTGLVGDFGFGLTNPPGESPGDL